MVRATAAVDRMFRVRVADAPAGRNAAAVLVLFAAADLFFIALHLAFGFGFTKDPVFSLEGDRIGGEFWQYVKEYWIAVVMGVLWWRRREVIYAAWSAVFLYLLADDSLQVHEKVGDRIGRALNLPAIGNLRWWDLGQTIFAASCAAALLAGIALLYRKADQDARRVTLTMITGLLLMGVFGVGADVLHALTALDALIVVEEGGELLVMSGICTLVVCEAWRELWSPSDRGARSGRGSATDVGHVAT